MHGVDHYLTQLKKVGLPENLFHLLLASIMGEGEIPLKNEKESFSYVTPIKKDVSLYLDQYIKSNYLRDRVYIEKSQLFFRKNLELDHVINDYYMDDLKVIITRLDPRRFTYDSIVLWINLYGTRVQDGIIVETTVKHDCMNALIYCIEAHLGVPVVLGKGNIKIKRVKDLYSSLIRKTSVTETARFVHFLSRKEVREMRDYKQEVGDQHCV
ncbi:hypothetical protein [Bacillus sp. SM2101]|uniref:hypothetical protein n=1 Tax=Bacillus sp. SM2101 TaxID=2805366 RepID=UPI001BDDDF85|nr:hypothetical protein [Bacillus sp. SM2101]